MPTTISFSLSLSLNLAFVYLYRFFFRCYRLLFCTFALSISYNLFAPFHSLGLYRTRSGLLASKKVCLTQTILQVGEKVSKFTTTPAAAPSEQTYGSKKSIKTTTTTTKTTFFNTTTQNCTSSWCSFSL